MTVVVKPNLQDLIGARLKPDRTTEFYSSAGVVRMGSVRLRSDYSLAHVGSLSASCGGGSDSRTVDKVGLVGDIFSSPFPKEVGKNAASSWKEGINLSLAGCMNHPTQLFALERFDCTTLPDVAVQRCELLGAMNLRTH